MNTFGALVIYMAIGGLVMAPATLAVEEKCGTETTVQDFAAVTIAWPAVLVGSLVYGLTDDGEEASCANKEQAK